MIDIEAELFTTIASALRSSFSGVFVAGEYVRQPSQFPAVSIVEMDNSVYLSGRDSLEIEHFADVMYQVDVYSNKNKGKKAECKAIMAFIDEWFAQFGFARTFYSPVQNMNDPSIYRVTARYQAVVGTDNTVYGRR